MCKRQIFSPSMLYYHSGKDTDDGPNSLAMLPLNVMVILFSLRWHRLANRASLHQETYKEGNWIIKVLEPTYLFLFPPQKRF